MPMRWVVGESDPDYTTCPACGYITPLGQPPVHRRGCRTWRERLDDRVGRCPVCDVFSWDGKVCRSCAEQLLL